MRPRHSLFFLVALAGDASAQNVKPVGERVNAQNALFEDQYQSDLRNFPERATSFGDYRYNDKLAEYSLAAIGQHHKTDQDFLARLEALPTSGFSGDLLQELMESRPVRAARDHLHAVAEH